MILQKMLLPKLILLATLSTLSFGCASNSKSDADGGVDVSLKNEQDKFESFNRKIFAFNLKLDRWFLKPAAKGYRKAAPEFVEVGVNNFFRNLNEVSNVANDLLQWKWKAAANDTGRFVINSIVGIGGLVDVAGHMGLERNHGEDFGQTLAAWGVPQGPYLMLPFWGPATVRAGIGIPFDAYASPLRVVEPKPARTALVVTNLVRQRVQFLDAEELATGDLYLFVRDAYLQNRKFLVNDGEVEDSFGSGGFGDDGFDDL